LYWKAGNKGDCTSYYYKKWGCINGEAICETGRCCLEFPWGSIEEGESPEQACIREVKEETGYDVQVNDLLHERNKKFSFLAEIIGGELFLDTNNQDNEDIVEVAWIPLNDSEKFDLITLPMLELARK
jgi:8-oxo-dGTP diphosphatase